MGILFKINRSLQRPTTKLAVKVLDKMAVAAHNEKLHAIANYCAKSASLAEVALNAMERSSSFKEYWKELAYNNEILEKEAAAFAAAGALGVIITNGKDLHDEEVFRAILKDFEVESCKKMIAAFNRILAGEDPVEACREWLQ